MLVTGTITATTVRSQYIYGDEIRVQGSGSWIKLTYNNDEFRRRRLKEAKDKGSELSEDELSRMMERSVNLHVVADAIEKLEKLGILDIDKAEEEKDAIVEKIKSNGKKGNTSWSVFSSSDRRLKEDVKPLSEQSKSLFDLQGVRKVLLYFVCTNEFPCAHRSFATHSPRALVCLPHLPHSSLFWDAPGFISL